MILEDFQQLDGASQEVLLNELSVLVESKSMVLANVAEELKAKQPRKPCFHCKSVNIWKRGTQSGNQMYQCKDCLKWYSETTGTPLDGIHLKHRWQEYVRLMQEGKSIKRIASIMGINVKTSFDWRHKILSALAEKEPAKLGELVECDEMELALSNKGELGLERKGRKRGTDFSRSSKEEPVNTVQVITAIDRQGNRYLKAVETKRINATQVRKTIGKKLSKGATLITDKHSSYLKYTKGLKTIKHKTVKASEQKQNADKVINLQHVNNTHKQLRDFLDRFNGVSTKYLQNYLNWFLYQKELDQTTKQMRAWFLTILTSESASSMINMLKSNAVNIKT